MDAGLNSLLLHVFLEGMPIRAGRKDNREEVECRFFLELGKRHFHDFRQIDAILEIRQSAQVVVIFELLELLNPKRCPDLVNAVVIPEGNHIVAVGVPLMAIVGQRGHPMRAQIFQTLGDFIDFSGDHTPLTRGQILIGEEGKTTDIAIGSGIDAFDNRTRRMRGILDHEDVIGSGEVEDLLHVTRVSSVVHDDESLGLGCDLFDDIRQRDGWVLQGGDIGEDDIRAGVEDGVGGGNKTERGDDDFIPGPDAECQAGHVEGIGGVGYCDGVFAVGGDGKVALECFGDFSHSEPFGFEDVEYGLFFFRAVSEIC